MGLYLFSQFEIVDIMPQCGTLFFIILFTVKVHIFDYLLARECFWKRD